MSIIAGILGGVFSIFLHNKGAKAFDTTVKASEDNALANSYAFYKQQVEFLERTVEIAMEEGDKDTYMRDSAELARYKVELDTVVAKLALRGVSL